MIVEKIRLPDGRLTWTATNCDYKIVPEIRDWVVHMEQTNISPNTIKAYVRHVVAFGSYLEINGKGFSTVDISDYDHFLSWISIRSDDIPIPTKNILLLKVSPSKRISAALKNQIHLAIKSFFRYFAIKSDFEFATDQVHNAFDSGKRYKVFLEHINQRRSTRRRDSYKSGDLSRVHKTVVSKRLTPEHVLKLVESCHLMRDALLIILLYTTGMRIGEALGLRHADMDSTEKIIWIVPRNDNENGARAKSGKTRSIPVPDYIMNMYEDFITSDEYIEAFESGTEYVLCNVKQAQIGRALSLSYANKLRTLLEHRTGIKFNWHMFRHTHASEAIAAGYSLLEVADRLGHSSPQTTADFYRHLFSAEIRKIHLNSHDTMMSRIERFKQAQILSGGDIKWL